MPLPIVPRRQQSIAPTSPLPGVRSKPGQFTPPQPIDIGPAAQQIQDIIQRERDKADQVAILDADNQLSDASIGLQSDALKMQGKDALNALPQAQDKWNQHVSEVESSLTNDRQRLAFKRMAVGRWEQLHETIARHTDAELEKYDADQTDTFVTNRLSDAVTGKMPVDEAIAETRAAIGDFGRRHGQPAEAVKAHTAERVSAIHVGLLEGMVARSEDLSASKYYAAHKDEVRGQDRAQVERALDVATTEGEGMRAADAVWKSLGPKSLNDPIKIADMERQIRDEQKDPKIVKAAIQELRSRATAHNAQQVEVTASNKAALLGAFAKGASVASLVRRPEYLTLSGTEQEQLKSYMLNRDYELDLRSDAAKAKRGFAAYWEYSEPSKLSAMSENEILALEPTLGRTLVGGLMTQKRAIVKNDGLLAATIDTDLFNTIANDAGFNPYDKNADKATLGRLKNSVESVIDQAQQLKGKALTRDEKKQVMQGVIDQKVMLDKFGRTDPEFPAATLSKDDRGIAYIPLERIPADVRKEAINWMRSNGLILAEESDAKAIARYRRRIERAYASRLTGGNAADIDAILRGK